MEEDIKILEERYKKAIDCINNTNLPLFVEDTVEDIFNRLEQDERVIEEMAEFLFYFKSHFLSLEEYNNKKQIIDRFRKKCE